MSRSNLLPNAFRWDFFGKVDFLKQPKSLEVHPNETMNNSQRSGLTFQLRSLIILDSHKYIKTYSPNHLSKLTQISYEAFLGPGNENLCKWFWSCDQDGRHTHIW